MKKSNSQYKQRITVGDSVILGKLRKLQNKHLLNMMDNKQ